MPTKPQSLAVMPSQGLFKKEQKSHYALVTPSMEEQDLALLVNRLNRDRKTLLAEQQMIQESGSHLGTEDITRKTDRALFKQLFEYAQSGGFSQGFQPNDSEQQLHAELFNTVATLIDTIDLSKEGADIAINPAAKNPFVDGYSRYQMLLIIQAASTIAKKNGREGYPNGEDFKHAEKSILVEECARYIQKMEQIKNTSPEKARAAENNIRHIQQELFNAGGRTALFNFQKALGSLESLSSSRPSSRSASPMSSPASSAPSSPAVSRHNSLIASSSRKSSDGSSPIPHMDL